MVETPSAKLSRLPILTDANKQSVIREFNDGSFSCSESFRIDDIFESNVELAPDATAAVDGTRALSFSELNGRANQLARILRRRGVRPGELIAVLLDPGMEAIVAIIAVLKVGCAYVAVAPAELRGGVLRTLRDHVPRIFIVAKRAEIASNIGDGQIIAFDVDSDAIGGESIENLQRKEATACDLACAVLTTVQRGQHCWMLLDHRNVTSMVLSLDERLHFTRFDVWALAHSMLSSIALMELWGPLFSGSQVTVVPAAATRDPESLCRSLEQFGVTVLNQTPSEFLHWADLAALTPRHQLHSVILSGEPVRAAELKAWFDLGRRWPQIIYLYGHHGLTIASAYLKVREFDVHRRSVGWLAGSPLSCARLYILDLHRQPVPTGVVGDVYVAGDSVARGYIQSRKSGEYVPDPFSTDPDGKLYRTGDQGYWTADGQVELVLAQSNSTSADVEASRVECELLSHPEVRHVSVVACRNEAGGDSLIAYVEGMRRTPTPAELRTFLELNVPAYMVPRKFICRGRTCLER
jgi:non-ribosomal peptide synthetase component F